MTNAEVGFDMPEVPEGWAPAVMGDLAEVVGGGTPDSKDPANFCSNAGYPWLTPADLSKFDGLYVARGARNLTDKGLSESSAKLLPKGTVLLSSRAPIGYVAVAANEVCTNQGFKSFVCSAALQPEFVANWFRFVRDRLQEMGSGSTFAELSGARAKTIPIPVAPLAEQRRIVAKVEALLEQVRRAKDRLDRVPLILKRFRQAVLAAACTGQLTEAWRVSNPDREAPARPAANRVARTRRQGANISKDGELLIDEMPDLPDSWAYWRADEVVDSDTVVTYGIVLPGPEHPGGAPYVRQQDIVDGGILVNELRHTTPAIAAKHARSTLGAGDVLLCIIRNLRVAMVPKGLDGANITQGMVRLRPGQHVRGDFLAAYLACPAAQGWMKARYFGMDMPRINVEDARAIPIALPPIDEQAEIMRRVDALLRLEEMVRGRLALAINRAGALPQAILSKAFAGELVPTEAEIASAEGRDYETAERMLARVRDEHVEDEVGLRLRQQSTGDKQTRRKRVRS